MFEPSGNSAWPKTAVSKLVKGGNRSKKSGKFTKEIRTVYVCWQQERKNIFTRNFLRRKFKVIFIVVSSE
jgi:hypothetical protein